MSEAKKFQVNVVFRGLFRAVPVLAADPPHLSVLLVDAREPRPTAHNPSELTHVHEPWIEFAESAWRNPEGGGQRTVTKNGVPMAQFRLDRKDLRFDASAGALGPDLEIDEANYRLLPQLDDIESGTGATAADLIDPASNDPGLAACLARVFMPAGRVTAERKSTRDGSEVQWVFTPAATPGTGTGSSTPMHLDLKATVEVDRGAYLTIEAREHGSTSSPRVFELAPEEGQAGPIEVRVWNAEPDLVRTGVGNEEAPNHNLDVDFVLHYDLSQVTGERRIPQTVAITSDGCCCGGVGGRPGG